jgi:(1->4)-alpha-D-glucan 1-alpha-D-glucosylmutase
VFEVTHRKAIELVRDGVIDGVRVDHPDGLANPTRYLHRLREAGIERVWVEKILEPSEQLRDWPVCGTTGYEFANDLTGLFVDPAAEEQLTELYGSFTGERRRFGEIAHEAKLEQARTTFEPEVDWLRAELGDRGSELDLPRALASFGVYRTYVDPDTGDVDDLDRRAIADAQLPAELAALLTLEERGKDAFVIRFQQTTPPVTAKGAEDTAFYRYNRLLCLNEVGSDPARWSVSIDEFHERNLERARRFPLQLLATQTHDTKRSGDARARLAALSWIPGEWGEQVGRWHATLGGEGAPDANEEYFVYQSLAAVAPIAGERLDAYLEKALREAKINTNWLDPDEGWEAAVKAFARAATRHVVPFAERLAALGEQIALSQTLLKLTCPGIPDLYQGDELWSLSLVDPDNRRPIDWRRNARLLAELQRGAKPTRETAKLYLVWKTLQLRAEHPAVFAGSYEPVDLGPGICAYLRGDEILVAVPVRSGARVDVPDGFVDVLGLDFGGRLLRRV